MRTWKSKLVVLLLTALLLPSCGPLVADKTITPLEGKTELELSITPGYAKANFQAVVCGMIDGQKDCPTLWDGDFFWEEEFVPENLPEYGEIRYSPISKVIHLYLHKSHFEKLKNPNP